jgi:hypothetical protein
LSVVNSQVAVPIVPAHIVWKARKKLLETHLRSFVPKLGRDHITAHFKITVNFVRFKL